METFAKQVWDALMSIDAAITAALIGAILTGLVSHHFAKRREVAAEERLVKREEAAEKRQEDRETAAEKRQEDRQAAAEKRQEDRQVAAEERQKLQDKAVAARHEKQLDEQRRDVAAEREERERIAAVKSYYTEFTEALRGDESYVMKFHHAEQATETFAMQILLLNSTAAHEAEQLLTPARRVYEANREDAGSAGGAMRIAVQLLRDHKKMLFRRLMEWAAHNDTRKIQLAIEELSKLANEKTAI